MMEPQTSTNISTRLERISKAGEGRPADGVPNARTSHRHRLAPRSLSAHAQGRRGWRGWTDCDGVCGEVGRQPSVAAQSREVLHVLRAACPTRAYPEG